MNGSDDLKQLVKRCSSGHSQECLGFVPEIMSIRQVLVFEAVSQQIGVKKDQCQVYHV